MAVTYTKEQRAIAKADGLHLVTLAVGGIEFQGPVSAEEKDRVTQFILGFLERRREWLAEQSGERS
jgi:hypothetical protein